MDREGIKFRIKRYLHGNHRVNLDYLNSLSLKDLINEYFVHKDVEKLKKKYFEVYKNQIIPIQYKYNYKKFDLIEILKTFKLNTPYYDVNIAINNVVKSHIMMNELPLSEDCNDNEFINTQRIFNKFYVDFILDEDKYW